MPSSGPRFPTAAVNNSVAPENADAWANPTNVFSDNAAEAAITAATFDSPDISQQLVTSGYGFAIPDGSTIDGIVVEIDRRSIIASSGVDNRVQLRNDSGALVGNNKATATVWPSSTAVATYGSSSDTWGASPTATMVNDPDFGVVLSAKANIANADIGVDFIRVTVHYTLGVISGSAASQVDLSQAADGDVLVEGAAGSAVAATQAATGGVAVQGAAASAVGASQSAAGTVATPSVSGAASSQVEVAQAADGVVDVVGIAASSVDPSQAAAGTVAVAGPAASIVEVTQDADGTSTVQGAASSQVDLAQAASGLVGVSGEAGSLIDVAQSAAGGIAVAGAAVSQVDAAQSGSGTVGTPASSGEAASLIGMNQAATGIVLVQGDAESLLQLAQSLSGEVLIRGLAVSLIGLTGQAMGSVGTTGSESVEHRRLSGELTALGVLGGTIVRREIGASIRPLGGAS